MNQASESLTKLPGLRPTYRRAGASALAASLFFCLLQPVRAQQEHPCGKLANAFGPYEYRADRYQPVPGDNSTYAFKLQLVEGAHFTMAVQRLTGGPTATKSGPDLDYTLRAFPNHHRALVTILDGSRRFADASMLNLPRSFECYFDRALRFAPDDSLARLLYASFLIDKKRIDEAKKQIEYAETQLGENPISHFNVGMIYFDIGEYEKALNQAHIAAAMGYPRSDLKSRLQSVGRWVEPAPAQASSAASAPTVPASAP